MEFGVWWAFASRRPRWLLGLPRLVPLCSLFPPKAEQSQTGFLPSGSCPFLSSLFYFLRKVIKYRRLALPWQQCGGGLLSTGALHVGRSAGRGAGGEEGEGNTRAPEEGEQGKAGKA